MQLLRDVYLLSGHCYGLHPNVYAVVLPDGSGLALIDTGLDGEDLAVIGRTMAHWGLDALPVAWVLLTHAHFDHAGNARHYRDCGAKIIAGASEADGLRLGDARTIPYAYSRPFPTCEADRIVEDREFLSLGGLDILCHTVPGHTRGSIAYEMAVAGTTVLFTGDFLMAAPDCREGVPGIAVGEDYAPADYLNSLRGLCDRKVEAVLGGHGHPALRGGVRLIHSAYRNMLVKRSYSIPTIG